MTYKDVLQESLKSKASALHLFLLTYPKTKSHIHAFFEGNDDSSFYTNFIKRFSNGEPLEIYKCGNKRAVYEVHAQITDRSLSNAKTVFFVDKDYSDLIEESWSEAPNIYVTDYYSIENHIVTEAMLERVWSDLLHSPFNKRTFEDVKLNFQNQLDRFYDFMLPITAWILHRKLNDERLNLNNMKISRICSIDKNLNLQVVDLESAIKSFERQCGVERLGEIKDDALSIADKLAEMNPKNYIRGKYELEFFTQFVNRLFDSFKGRPDQYGQNIKILVNISNANAFEILGPRVQPPDSLRDFLQNNLKEAA